MDKALEELLKQLSRKELPFAFAENDLLQRIRAEAELRSKRGRKRKWSARILTAAAASLAAGVIGFKSYTIGHTHPQQTGNASLSQAESPRAGATILQTAKNADLAGKQIPTDEKAAVDGYFTGLLHKDQSELNQWISSSLQKGKSVLGIDNSVTIGYSIQPNEMNSSLVMVNRSFYEPNPNGAFSQVIQTQITYGTENGRKVISGFRDRTIWLYRVEDSGSLVELVNTGGVDTRKVLQTADEIGSGTILQIAVDPRNPEQFAYLKKMSNGNDQMIMRVGAKNSLVSVDVPAGAQQAVWSSDSLHIGVWVPDIAHSSAELIVLNTVTGEKDEQKFSFADQNALKNAWIDAAGNGSIEVYQPDTKNSKQYDPNSHRMTPPVHSH